MERHEFETLEAKNAMIAFNDGKFSINECLIVRMLKANHPDQTISFRFEERTTGKIFVFLTDHENTETIPSAFRDHLLGADLLIADAQYDSNTYERKKNWGHGTGEYVVRLAEACQVKRAGLTHHDPGSNDTKIEMILAEALAARDQKDGFTSLNVFSCRDLEVIEV